MARVTNSLRGIAVRAADRQTEGITAAARREAEGRMLPGKKRPADPTALRRLVGDGTSVTEAARVSRSTAYATLAANPA